MQWFIDNVADYISQLRSFTPIMLRKNVEIDIFLRVCDSCKKTLDKLKNANATGTMADTFKMAAYVEQINNLLIFAGKLLKRSIKTTSAVVSSIDVAENISKIGKYTGSVARFIAHENQRAITEDLAAGIDCTDITAASHLYKKYNTVAIWVSIVQRCGNYALAEASKNDALHTGDLPEVMMPTWIEQMPQLFIRAATPFTEQNLADFCTSNKIHASIISVSNFKSSDIDYVLPATAVSPAVGISPEYVRATNTIVHIASGSIVGGITHTRTSGVRAIIETNGVSSRFIESGENILRGTPSTRIHNYNLTMEHQIIKKMRPHIAVDITKVDYNTMIDSVINLLMSYYTADDIESRLCNLIPNMSDPEIRITALRSIAPIILEIRSNNERLTPEVIRDMVICKTGIVENVLRKAYIV